jgi:archaeal type IV pilus assembly protein PilA
MNFEKKIRKFRKETRAISPVIATLLMIAIAVVASLVTYAWVMGYMSFTTEKTSKAIQIQSVDFAGGKVYVQNVGDSQVSFTATCVFVNGADKTGTAPSAPLGAGDTIAITVSSGTFVAGHTYTIKVTSEDGTFSQIDKTYPLP